MSLTRQCAGWQLSRARILAVSGVAWACAQPAPKSEQPTAGSFMPRASGHPELKVAPNAGSPAAQRVEVILGTVLDGRQLTLTFEQGTCNDDPNPEANATEATRKLQLNVGGATPQTFSVATDAVPTACSSDLAVPLEKGDFNFDGAEDFALPLDQTGPYGSVTYRVFIYDRAAARYVEAPGFSALTQEFIGIFALDAKRKVLQVESKSGCCIYYVSEFSVNGLDPVLQSSVTISHDPVSGGCSVLTKTRKPNGKTRSTERRCTTAEEKGE